MASGLVLVLAAWAGAYAAVAVPPARPPKVVLTLKGERQGDVRRPVYEGRRILLDEDSFPRKPARLAEGPTVRRQGGKVVIAFALDRPDDVLVRIVDAKGRAVRNLACGVLGDNAPEPFVPKSLHQELAWDGTDASGRPAPAGCKVRVAVGLTPRFDRFVAYDPGQLLPVVCGVEVDAQGRVYVAPFTDRRGDPHLIRYDREGRYLDTLYPPDPNCLRGKLEDAYPTVYHVDGQAVPQKVGGPWPYLVYKYHGGGEGDPSRYLFPLRIAPDGNAYLGEPRSNLVESSLTRATWPKLGLRVLPLELDPFWFYGGLTMGEGPWALDAHGFGYMSRPGVIYKVRLDTAQAAADFEYNGTVKLPEKRAFLGIPKRRTGKGSRFGLVTDLTVDRDGTLYAVENYKIWIFLANGQRVGNLTHFTHGGKTHPIGAVYGIRAASDALYVVGRIEPIAKGRWRRAQLLKLRVGPGLEAQALWTRSLDPLANVVAVDERADPRLVWVGNGGGKATFSRIEDLGTRSGAIRHCGGGVRNGKLMYPWAIAVDGRGRVFAYDRSRSRIVRTNDDGSDWLEAPHPSPLGTKALHADRTRGRLFISSQRRLSCTDLDLKEARGIAFPSEPTSGRSGPNFGAVDRAGTLYVSTLRKGDKARGYPGGLHGLVSQYGPDGSLKKVDYCQTFLPDGALAMDSRGCLYVTDTVKMGFIDSVHNWAVGRGPKWKRGGHVIRSQSEIAYLVKFPPTGGIRGTDTELWAHRGVSPVMGGGCQCPIATNCVACDASDRIYAADYNLYHVKVLDTAGNLITRVGAWGGADCQGPASKFPKPDVAFTWLHSIDAFGDALYASDKDLRRIVKVRMDYRHAQQAPIP